MAVLNKVHKQGICTVQAILSKYHCFLNNSLVCLYNNYTGVCVHVYKANLSYTQPVDKTCRFCSIDCHHTMVNKPIV